MSPARRGSSTPAQPELGLDLGLYDRRHHPREAGAPRPAPEAFDPLTVPLDPGIALVEASAGTGKTFCITLTVLRLLLDQDASGKPRVRDVGSILVVTFTNAATDELTTRIRAALREAVDVFAGVTTERTVKNTAIYSLRERYGATADDLARATARLRQALSMLDRLSVFTIHGFCQRVLQESALESGTPFDAGFLEDDALLVDRVAQDWWRRTIYGDDRLAALAVHGDWTWNQFLARDFASWRRWPDVVIEPRESMAEAMRALDDALATFARAWDPVRATAFLAERKWMADSPCRDPLAQRALVQAGNALAAGDVGAGLALVAACTTAAMQGKKGCQKRAAALWEAIASEPFAMACDAIAAATTRVHQALRVSCLETVERDFDGEKRRRHLMGFDDLLRRLATALGEEAKGGTPHLATAIRARWDAALIDEFQDTDPWQFPIFSTAFEGRPLFLIGDPKQAIYGFRGADVFAYMDAARAAERHYTLGGNWRSSERMVGATNALFARRPDAFLYHEIPFAPVRAARDLADPLTGDGRGALHWWWVPPARNDRDLSAKALPKGEAQDRLHATLVNETLRLVRDERDGGMGLAPGRIAVLVRTGREGAAVQRALREAGVPAILAGMGDILESNEMAELERVLRAVAAPQDARAVRAALVTMLWGTNASTLHRLADPAHEGEWHAIVDRLAQARETWARHGFMRMVQEMMAATGMAERLLASGDGERSATNLRHAVELLHAASVEERLSPEGLLLWVGRARARGSEDAERTELRLESDADAVQVLTIHRSKGLEWDVVMVPGLWEPRPPVDGEPVTVHEADGTVVFDHGSPARDRRGLLADAERLAEELRLAYVALTRSRLRCYVGWAGAANARGGGAAWRSALGWLLRETAHGADPAIATRDAAEALAASLGTWEASLQAMVAGSEGAMSMETIAAAPAPAPRWAGRVASARDASPRAPVPAFSQMETWRVSSFTALTAGGGHTAHDDGRDTMDDAAMAAEREAHVPRRDDFLDFPAGREAGIALHALFERAAFDAEAPALLALATEELVRARLASGADDPRLDATVGMMRRVLGAPLPGATFALRDVAMARTLREWKFDLPMGAVERATLAELFERHGGPEAKAYAPALRQLAPRRAYGFLTGVVDLAFEHDGRWWIADWKSNHLGHDAAQYERESLATEMTASHYVLQYHLYVTALHRFLRVRMPGYAYETHMGGVWYAFLRGIDGASDRGWWHDRPPVALIEALSALMDAGIEGTA